MSITKGFFRLLIDAKRKGFIKGGSILQLGRQSAFLSFQVAQECLREAGVPFPEVKPELGFSADAMESQSIDDKTLFGLLGFDVVHSLDISDYENATHIHDLNLPKPNTIQDQYDVIYDGGTLEHVFSTLQCLKNIHDYLKIGGVIIHSNPAHNHLDHGFFSFSPQMYHDYYTANKYKILDSYLLESFKDSYTSFNAYRYEPGQLELLQFGGYGREMLANWFIALKQISSTNNQIPNQGCSRIKYPPQMTSAIKQTSSNIKKFIKKIHFLYSMARSAKRYSTDLFHVLRRWKRKLNRVGAGTKLELVGRY